MYLLIKKYINISKCQKSKYLRKGRGAEGEAGVGKLLEINIQNCGKTYKSNSFSGKSNFSRKRLQWVVVENDYACQT